MRCLFAPHMLLSCFTQHGQVCVFAPLCWIPGAIELCWIPGAIEIPDQYVYSLTPPWPHGCDHLFGGCSDPWLVPQKDFWRPAVEDAGYINGTCPGSAPRYFEKNIHFSSLPWRRRLNSPTKRDCCLDRQEQYFNRFKPKMPKNDAAVRVSPENPRLQALGAGKMDEDEEESR